MDKKFERSEWFRHDRFGMFIHWGLYAIPARGEWIRNIENISNEDYEQYYNEFNPTEYNPVEWARLAKKAGMKYAVLTAKHHDGFCLFDSALTDYKSTNTRCKRDLVREYVEAFRAEGIKVGLYYSLLDWHHPAYPAYGDTHHPMRDNPAYAEREPFENYVSYLHGQVKELCTNYGKIDLLWFDFSYGKMFGDTWQAEKLVAMIRSYQKDVLIDNRLEESNKSSIMTGIPCSFSGDFFSPEQIIPPDGVKDVHGEPVPWEACITLNEHWGYCSNDFNYKNPAMVVRKLTECVSKGGNMLLNVGPNAKGVIPPESVAILERVGEWMQKNGESLVGCGYAHLAKPDWGRYTRNGNTVYAHVIDWPIGYLQLSGIPAEKVKSIRLLSDGSEMHVVNDWVTAQYSDLTFTSITPYEKYDELSTVVKIELMD